MEEKSVRTSSGVITLNYDSSEKAKSIFGAVDVDNKGYVTARLDGRKIFFQCQCQEPGMLKNTLDDLLSCIGIAERMVEFQNNESSEK
ncbi:MAG: KEOPS complex subunit Pcc1 [Candidatus Thermoplasmatota archaeon]|jgi:hypothetical protein|nr:KEOPS complex subunit Pcc1 [Candidatus Thermoplasmatota archaeon]MDP7266378.1 KEOPS complex subunit Pcc1 [Candidatus Thermoplasmatota archaeon]MDP7422139.1 KEOPS complex subunit Pcc1 [bacterium]